VFDEPQEQEILSPDLTSGCLPGDHSAMWLSSSSSVYNTTAGTIKYVSSAYLSNLVYMVAGPQVGSSDDV